MKNRIALVLLFAGVAAGTLVGYALHRPPPASNGREVVVAPPASTTPAGQKRVLYWYDPMQPAQHFDQPGKSPFMDMQLVPKYADGDAGGDGNIVPNSTGTAQNLGVRTALVERGALGGNLRAVGSVGYDEHAVEVVQARTGGYVEHLYVRAALDRVRRGQALVDIVAPDWVAAEEEYLALRRLPSADAALRDAARMRLAVLGVPDDQIRALERSGTVRTRTTLVAPIDGVVTELGARDGMAVSAGTPLFRINGLARVWITAEVPEAQSADARAGAAVSISVPAWPGRTFAGTVAATVPSVAAATRTLQVRIEAANADGALSPGMYASVEFPVTAGEPRLLVPSESVIRTGTRSVVIVAGAAGFRPVEVQTGAERDGRTEILRGLDEGEKIVVSGQFLIDSEASLRATLTRMGATTNEARP